MKKSLLNSFSLLLFISNIGIGLSQTAGITSGAIYTLQSKASNKLLNVSNSSNDYGANVDCWTDTGSDSERWIATWVSDSTYTLTNVASAKFLHVTSTPANSINVDQYPNTTNIKWIIAAAGDGSFYLKASSNKKFALNLNAGGTTDGTNVNVFQWSVTDAQKWTFTAEVAKDIAPSASVADQVYTSWKANYYDTRTGNEVVKGEGFWGEAEIMEIILDAYEATGNTKYKTQFAQMYNLFITKEGSDWTWNEYNDDITWMAIACSRAGLLTGNSVYIAKAKEQFDKMYTRAATDLYGGGLIWKQGTLTKNACINGPAMVACCYLAQATGDNTYYNKALTLYTWSKNYLFNNTTGKVNDAYDGTVHDWSSTYNQGTYLGAAVMLYDYTKDPAYLTDATKIASFTKSTMYNQAVINNEEGPDLSGFKGIFMRYARRYGVDGYKTDLISWIRLNAKIAYNNRNSGNIISTLWGTRTAESATITAFGASTAMSLLFNCPLVTTLRKDAFQTIEAENFDYLKGVTVEACSEGTSNLTTVANNYYTAYYNVDFGTIGADSAKFRLSTITTGGTIEIHLGSTSGTLIGTTILPNTAYWNSYTTITCPISITKGMQNIYLVYKGGSTVCKLNNFWFVEDLNSAISTVSKENNFFEIYPNPGSSKITVKYVDQRIKTIAIADLSGKLLTQRVAENNGDETFDVSYLSKGIYLITVLTDKNEKAVKRFIKNDTLSLN